jgi:hypothetical protein
MPAPVSRAALAATGITAFITVAVTASPAWASNGPLQPGPTNGDVASANSDPVLRQITSSVHTRVAPRGADQAAAPDPCDWLPGDLGTFLENEDRTTSRVLPNGQRQTLYARICNGVTTWYWIGQADAGQLAAAALATARGELPNPVGVFSPNIASGGTNAVVNFPLRVDVARWAPIQASATVPGLTATVTATPARLEFVPGDGSPALTCGQVGQVGQTPGAGCTYTYRDASTVAPNGRTWPAQLRITWQVGWAATNGAGGALAPMTTTTNYAVPVGEIEAIEHGG